MSKFRPSLAISVIAMFANLGVSVCMAASSGYFINVEGAWVAPVQSTQTYTVAMPNTPLPPLLDDYVSNNRTYSHSVGVGFGYQFAQPDWAKATWLPNYRIGLLYNYFIHSTVNGTVEKYQQVPAYNFRYNIRSRVLWLNGQADLVTWNLFTPFVELGLGAASNSSYEYDETPLTDQPRVGAAFANKTVTQLAYNAGVGVAYAWHVEQDILNVGLQYRYADLGSAHTGASTNYQAASRGLTMPIKANELLLSIRTDL